MVGIFSDRVLVLKKRLELVRKGVQYLGCKHIRESVQMHDGGVATVMVYGMG